MWQDLVNSLYAYAAWLVVNAVFLAFRLVMERGEIRARIKAFAGGVLLGVLALLVLQGIRYLDGRELLPGLSYRANPFLFTLAVIPTSFGIILCAVALAGLGVWHLMRIVESWLVSDRAVQLKQWEL